MEDMEDMEDILTMKKRIFLFFCLVRFRGFIMIASTAAQVRASNRGGTTGDKIQPAPHHSSILLVLGGLPIPFRQRVLLDYGPAPRWRGPGRNSPSLCEEYPILLIIRSLRKVSIVEKEKLWCLLIVIIWQMFLGKPPLRHWREFCQHCRDP